MLVAGAELVSYSTWHDGWSYLESEEVEREVPWRDKARHPQRCPAGDVHHTGGLLPVGGLSQSLPGESELPSEFWIKNSLILCPVVSWHTWSSGPPSGCPGSAPDSPASPGRGTRLGPATPGWSRSCRRSWGGTWPSSHSPARPRQGRHRQPLSQRLLPRWGRSWAAGRPPPRWRGSGWGRTRSASASIVD